MEASHSQLKAGETSGGEDQPRCATPTVSCTPQPSTSQPANPGQDGQDSKRHCCPSNSNRTEPKPPRRPHQERKRLRLQRRHAQDTETIKEGGAAKDAGPSQVSSKGGASNQVSKEEPPSAPRVPSLSDAAPSNITEEIQDGTPKQKRERKPQKPGKYVCSYCGRACAKPSVLQKHIRSHTGERPYPCGPCGFSFKTKSNLYKHRKSHTHRVKAGLAPPNKDEHAVGGQEEMLTDSEDDSNRAPATSSVKKQGGVLGSQVPYSMEPCSSDQSRGLGDSHAVKKRLALRLSKTKQAPAVGSSDDVSSSLALGSRGSTESGYFSRSESTEQSQDSPPNSSAKSYAEIILGKYGRLGHLQRAARSQQQGSGGPEGKGIPFNLPKKQVIDHITKLITINEAVMDTSKIDSVKPRRFSLSRRSSTESAKTAALKEPLVHCPKVTEASSKGSGSITLGVPCQKFHQQSLNIEQCPSQASAAPLLRSLSVPSEPPACTTDASPRHLRLSQSFDEQPPSQTNRRHALLRRQPAIELPISCDFTPEKLPTPSSTTATATATTTMSSRSLVYHQDVQNPSNQKQRLIEPYECEECGTGCKDWESYKTHRRQYCKVHGQAQKMEPVSVPVENAVRMHFMSRPGALMVRKRRKEDSLELDDSCSLVSLPSTSEKSPQTLSESTSELQIAPRQGTRLEKDPERSLKGISVIQHTSSFEKQERNMFVKSKGNDDQDTFAHLEHRSASPQLPDQIPRSPGFRKLVRQPNVQVPEILVTEDTNTAMPMSPTATVSTVAKETDRSDETFQWPQRSSTLAQLPIEKLPPKKKRLRLAEAAQSSGDSSFESMSLPPRSPSQDSNMSCTSSRSASFEDLGKSGDEGMTSGRRSRGTHMLAVPSSSHHHHREMRRSASEQAPHVPQQCTPISEARSKSFDYSSLSPDRTPAGWRERRKCLLLRHTPVQDPDEEEPSSQEASSRSGPCGSMQSSFCTGSAPPTSPINPDLAPTEHPRCTQTTCDKPPVHSHCQNSPAALWQQNPSLTSKEFNKLPEVLPSRSIEHKSEQATLAVYMGPEGVQHGPGHPSSQGPSGAAKARYCPGASSLKLETSAVRGPMEESQPRAAFSSQPSVHHQHQHVYFSITPDSEPLRPAGMQTVATRIQGNIPIHASAIYTTLSHNVDAMKPQELRSSVHQNVTSDVSAAMCVDPTSGPLGGVASDSQQQGCSRSVGSGGSKRMLSPSSSVEFGPDSQQQKRVKEDNKEEEEEEEEDVEEGDKRNKLQLPDPVKTDEHPVEQSDKQASSTHSLFSATTNTVTTTTTTNSNKETSMPTLHSKPEYSWCYLHYAKPSPSPLSDHQSSVYSSWSTSAYNPNPPGLSSKEMLSLLHCKQGHSSSVTYTMAPMSPPTTPGEEKEKEGPVADPRKPSVSEVHPTRHDHSTEAREVQSTKYKTEEEEDEEEEDYGEERKKSIATSKQSEPPTAQSCEGGSNEECVSVHGRRGGQNVCEDCGGTGRRPGTLGKHICLHATQRAHICHHCNLTFKTKGNLLKHLKSKAHGKSSEGSVPDSTSHDVETETETSEAGGSEGRSARTETSDKQPMADNEDTEEEAEETEGKDEEEDDEDYVEGLEDEMKGLSDMCGRHMAARLASLEGNRTKEDTLKSKSKSECNQSINPPHHSQYAFSSLRTSPCIHTVTVPRPHTFTSTHTVTVPRPHPESQRGRSCSSPILSLSPGRCLSPALPQSLSLSVSASPGREGCSSPDSSHHPRLHPHPCQSLCPAQGRRLSPSPSRCSAGDHPQSPAVSSESHRSPYCGRHLSSSTGREAEGVSPQSACIAAGASESGSAPRTSICGSSCPEGTAVSRYKGSLGGMSNSVAIQALLSPLDRPVSLPVSQLSAPCSQQHHHHHHHHQAQRHSAQHHSSSTPREGCGLLSHLPLHSQPPARSPSLLIPIGGIHMVQPRSGAYRLGCTLGSQPLQSLQPLEPQRLRAMASTTARPCARQAGTSQLCRELTNHGPQGNKASAAATQSEVPLLSDRDGCCRVCVRKQEGEASSETQTPGSVPKAQHTQTHTQTHSHTHTHTNKHTAPDKHLNCTY